MPVHCLIFNAFYHRPFFVLSVQLGAVQSVYKYTTFEEMFRQLKTAGFDGV